MKPLSATRYATRFRRTVDHLKAWQVQLPPGVTRAEVVLTPTGARGTGARVFACENVPQLKYHNPGLKVDVSVGKGLPQAPLIRFNVVDRDLSLNVDGLSAEEIKDLVSSTDWSKVDS